MHRWLFFAVFASGCTNAAAAPWVPNLTLRGALVSGDAVSVGGTRSSWDWRVAADLRWSPGRSVPRVPELEISPARFDAARSPCVDAALCAWEERARARALVSWEAAR